MFENFFFKRGYLLSHVFETKFYLCTAGTKIWNFIFTGLSKSGKIDDFLKNWFLYPLNFLTSLALQKSAGAMSKTSKL